MTITANTWHSGTVQANGITIAYTRTGGGGPPLVLAHGMTDNGLCWAPLAATLAPEYDLVMVDARGHGRSAAPAQGYTPADQAADLAGLIAALGLERPAILGHSLGAITALVLAGSYPELPRAILLEDPPPWWVIPDTITPEMQARTDGINAWLAQIKQQSRTELFAFSRADEPGWSEADREPWVEAKLQFSPQIADVLRPETPASVDWPAVLGHIRCPALLITAEVARGAATSPEAAAALQTHLPQLQIAPIAGAGHSIRRDQPAAYLMAVRAFLSKTP